MISRYAYLHFHADRIREYETWTVNESDLRIEE